MSTRKAPTVRQITGRNKIFADADELLRRAYEYFDYVDDNPITREEIVKYKDDYERVDVRLGRHYSVDGLCVFLGVSARYFYQAERQLSAKAEPSEEDLDLLDAYDHIRTVIRDQQISGAVTRIFDSNIVAKMNGITDRIDVTSGDKPVINVIVRDDKTAQDLSEIDDLI